MSLEQISPGYWSMTPAPFDVHAHPRAFDAITPDGFVAVNEGQDGKAGVRIYSTVAIQSGITGFSIMPNEAVRLPDVHSPELTELIQYPIATLDKVRALQAIVGAESVVPAAIHYGIDPAQIFVDERQTRIDDVKVYANFSEVGDECTSLKVYLADTTGGNNISATHGPEVAGIWNELHPEKPVVFHVEGGDVATVLREIGKTKEGKEQPIHIAHVSSREELEAVIEAKKAGMNVTCEVTPHHLFLTAETRQELGGYGCMKPSLKSDEDREFLWANMRYIDIIASDCAPHRRSDKEAANPAYGVTNHTAMLPLLFGAVADGKITVEELYDKLCVQPRKRFNLPMDDGSYLGYSTNVSHLPEEYAKAPYGYTPFSRTKQQLRMVGEVIIAKAGTSEYSIWRGSELVRPSRTHLMRPKEFNEEYWRRYENS